MKKGKKEFFKRYGLYILRWQCSSPLLALFLVWFAGLGTVWATILANFVGSIIFFWVDKIIFKDKR